MRITPSSGGNAELVDDLPGVVVPGPDEDVLGVELAHQRLRPDAGDGEGDGRHAVADAGRVGDAVDRQAVDLGQAVDQLQRQRRLVGDRGGEGGGDLVAARAGGASRRTDALEIADRRRQPGHQLDLRRAELEALGQLVGRAAAFVGLQRIDHVAPPPQTCPYAARRICRRSRRGSRSRGPRRRPARAARTARRRHRSARRPPSPASPAASPD